MSHPFHYPGTSVVWRSRPGGRIGYTLSAWVVADTPVYTVLYQPAGSICMQRTGVRSGPNGRNLIAWWDWDRATLEVTHGHSDQPDPAGRSGRS
jgi:hypothetical protein